MKGRKGEREKGRKGDEGDEETDRFKVVLLVVKKKILIITHREAQRSIRSTE